MDPQDLTLNMQEKGDYLYVSAGGMRSRDTVKTMTIKVFQAALDRRLSKVLIDVRDMVGNFGIPDIYFLVKDVLKDLRGKGVDQVAVIDVRRSPNPGWFLEPVAQHRGLNFRVFAEDESALKWLKG
jgi:hypothetical protein